MSRTATRTWRQIARAIREEGRKHNLPCHLCRGALGPIDYRTQAEADRDARADGRWWEIGQPRPLAFHADHIIAHAAGGTDSRENAVQSHAVCNERAGAKQAPRTTRQPRQKATAGLWVPKTNEGETLAGYAVPGTETPTHIFTTPGG
ncbi:HNH endonuclease [Microbacterium sp. SORGH_AS_0888]|uniref:HNH endonuclease n=1 Tax=Microbacterium sp. SORGH_AS_0888 TaxID=3041791 RepID=UPI0035902130